MSSCRIRFLLAALWLLLVFPLEPALSQETKRLRYAVTAPANYLPIWAAKHGDIFKKHGLDVEVIFMRGGSMITMGIIGGELQLSGVGAESVVAARVEGADIALFACPVDTELVYLIARPEIKNASELKGKASSVNRLGSSTHLYLRYALRQVGLDPDRDMTILQLGSGPETAAALLAGRIAAAALSYRDALPFFQRGWPVLVDLTKTDFRYPPSCVAGSRSFVQRNPITTDRFLRAYVEAIHKIKTDQPFAHRVYAKVYRDSDAARIEKVVQSYGSQFKRVPYVPDQGIEFVLKELSQRRPVPKEFVGHPEQFRDHGPLDKIVKEGWIDQLYKQ